MFLVYAVLFINFNVMSVYSNAMEEIWRLHFEPSTLPGIAVKEGETTLVSLLEKAGLKTALSAIYDITLFGPTNTAFEALEPGLLDYLINDRKALAKVLLYHVVPSRVYTGQLINELLIPTLDGKSNQIRINVYKNGSVFTASGRPIILDKANTNASNGVLHELGGVMFPPVGNMVAALGKCPLFKTMTSLIRDADLVSTLSGTGPFTLFAPTDEAFSKLPPNLIDDLLKNKTKLANVLKYHVIRGTYYKAGLTSGSVETLNGKFVDINVALNMIKVNDAKVFLKGTDVTIVNGVVHTLESVLLPPDATQEMTSDFTENVNLIKRLKLN